MRLNWDTVIVGRKVVLVPYREPYVQRYHAWMQDEELLRLTASEKLTLEEEVANCASWREDEKKLTFIVLDKNECNRGCGLAAFPVEAMIGDVNVFIDPDDPTRGEVEVMIAESTSRRKGVGSEALLLLMSYAKLKVFVAKIGASNAPSLAMFKKIGFREVNYSAVFEEHELQLDQHEILLPLSTTSYDAPGEEGSCCFENVEFEVAVGDEKFKCVIFLYGAKCAWIWVGKEPSRLGAMHVAAPHPFEHGMSAVTPILDPLDGVGSPMAQRLSKRSGRLVVVSWSLGEDYAEYAPRVELAVRERLPAFGEEAGKSALVEDPPKEALKRTSLVEDLFDDDDDDDETLPMPPPAPRRSPAAALPALPATSATQALTTPTASYFGTTRNLVFLSEAMRAEEAVESIIGGRGYVAARHIEAGELLLVEKPVLSRTTVDRHDPVEDATEQLIGLTEADDELRAAVSRLHPVLSLEDEEAENLKEKRLALVWRFNAFESGIYLHRSLFNDDAKWNATQLLATTGESEVWATENISKGSNITLSYPYPKRCTAKKREEYLVAHHGFFDDVGDPTLPADLELEAALDDVEAKLTVAEKKAEGGSASASRLEKVLVSARETRRSVNRDTAPTLASRAHSLVARTADAAFAMGVSTTAATWAVVGGGDAAVAEISGGRPALARDAEALRSALLWMAALDAYDTDMATAAGIAAAALGRVAQSSKRSALEKFLDFWDCDVTHAQTTLQAQADNSRALYDSARWLR